MLKRKWALKQIFNGISAKSPQPSSPTGDGNIYDSDSGDEDHFDPSTVDRPYLDSKTEAQLRDACAVILRNLKPSGYDIEDTRMKSDILVEDLSDQDEPPLATLNTAKQQSQQKNVSSTWYQDDSSRNSRVTAHSGSDAAEKHKSNSTSIAASFNAKRKADHKRVSDTMQQEHGSLNVGVIKQVESPIAPVASVRIQSSQAISPPVAARASNHRGTSVGRNGSASTMSTQHTTSTNGIPSISTGVTSTAQTPASNSKRTSDPTKFETSSTDSADATARTGTWMKEEVQKRRQAAMTKSEASTGYQSGATDDTIQAADQYLQAQAVPLIYGRASNQNLKTENSNDAALDASGSRLGPQSSNQFGNKGSWNSDERTRGASSTAAPSYDNPRTFSPGAKPDIKTTETLKYRETGVSSPSPLTATSYKYDVTQQEQSDYDNSPSPLLTDFDATLAAIRARMAATSLSARPVNAMLPEQPGPQSPGGYTDPSSRSQNSTRGANSQSHSSRHIVPQIPPIPNKAQIDESAINKDFWIPPGTQSDRGGTGDRRSRIAQPNDIDAVEFDTFMSVVEKANTNGTRTVAPIIVRQLSSDQATDFQRPAATGTTQPDGLLPVSPISPSAARTDFSRSTTMSGRSLSVSTDQPITPPSRDLSPVFQSNPIPPMPFTLARHSPSHTEVTSPGLRSTPGSSKRTPQPLQVYNAPNDQQAPRDYIQDGLQSPPTETRAPSSNPAQDTTVSQGLRATSMTNKSIKSPSRLSTSSRTPSQHAKNAPSLHSQPDNAPKSVFRKIMGRQKNKASASSIRFNHGNGTSHGHFGQGHGDSYAHGNIIEYETLEDPEYDDPLVCAAPVVAFGKGW